MAKMTADQLIHAFKVLTLTALSYSVPKLAAIFEVSAAAPVAVAPAGGAADEAVE